MSTISTIIRAARIQQGRTLAEVATAAGISLPYLSQLEHGKDGAPEMLRRLASVLDIDEARIADAYIRDAITAAKCKWFRDTSVSNEQPEYSEFSRSGM